MKNVPGTLAPVNAHGLKRTWFLLGTSLNKKKHYSDLIIFTYFKDLAWMLGRAASSW